MIDVDVVEYCSIRGVNPRFDLWGLPRMNLAASYKGLCKYGKDQPNFDAKVLRRCEEALLKVFGVGCCDSLITDVNVCISMLDPQSSPGYPFSLDYSNNKTFIENEDVVSIAMSFWNSLSSEVVPWRIWKNSLKEEVRDQVKLSENSIRVFTAAPADLTITSNMLCYDFNQKMNKNCLNKGHCVGFNPFNLGWNGLYRRLNVFPMHLDLDMKQQDSSMFRSLLGCVYRFRWESFHVSLKTSENFNRLKNLLVNLLDSVILTADGYLVQKHTGIPSGSGNTLNDNTLCNFLLFCYCYFVTFPDKTFCEFQQELLTFMCGDDNHVAALNSEFTVEKIISAGHELGITYTTEKGWTTLSNSSFLSRGFDLFVENRCIPHLDEEKLLVSLCYSERNSDPVYSLIRACGFRNVLWGCPMFLVVDDYVKYLISKYDFPLRGEREWQEAKMSILTEYELHQLYLTDEFVRQSYGELNKVQRPIKEIMDGKTNQQQQPQLRTVIQEEKRLLKAARKAERAAKRAQQPNLGTPKVNKPNRIVLPKGNGQADRRLVPLATRQSLAQFKPKKRLSVPAAKMLEAITLPKQAPPLRIGGKYGTDPSAAASVFDEPVVNWVTGDANTQAFVFRSALRAMVKKYVPAPTLAGTTMYSGYQTLVNEISAGFINGPEYFAPVAFESNASPDSILSPHGLYLYPGSLGKSDPFRGFWADTGTNITFDIEGLNTGDTCVFKPYLLVDKEWKECPSIELDLALSTKTIRFNNRTDFPPLGILSIIGAYLAFTVQVTTAAANSTPLNATISYSWDGTLVTTGWAQTSLPDLDPIIGSIDQIRIMGASLMFTNTSAAVARQGQSAGLQCDGQTDWIDFVGYDAVTKGKRKHVAFENAEGMYGFLMPQEDSDFNWLGEIGNGTPTDTISGPDGIQNATFDIYPNSAYITICVNADPAFNRTGYWTNAYSVEYSSQNQWTSIALPEYKFHLYLAGAELVTTCPQWHQNFPHIDEIWSWVKSAASGVKDAIVDYGIPLAKAAMTVAPLLL